MILGLHKGTLGNFLSQSLRLSLSLSNLVAILYAGIVVIAGGFILYAITVRQYPLTAHAIFYKTRYFSYVCLGIVKKTY